MHLRPILCRFAFEMAVYENFLNSILQVSGRNKQYQIDNVTKFVIMMLDYCSREVNSDFLTDVRTQEFENQNLNFARENLLIEFF